MTASFRPCSTEMILPCLSSPLDVLEHLFQFKKNNRKPIENVQFISSLLCIMHAAGVNVHGAQALRSYKFLRMLANADSHDLP